MSIFFKTFGPYSKLRTANWPIAWWKQTQPYNNTPYFPLKILHSILFDFSWDNCNIQQKLKTKVMQTLGGQTRCVKGDVQMENGSSSPRSYITYNPLCWGVNLSWKGCIAWGKKFLPLGLLLCHTNPCLFFYDTVYRVSILWLTPFFSFIWNRL